MDTFRNIYCFDLIIERFLSVGSRIFFLIRRFSGVTSKSSSVSMNSSDSSRLITLGVTSLSASSALDDLVREFDSYRFPL